MGSEKISVIVPAYNIAAWLPRALNSLLAQTYGNLEIIVVDDGSADDTKVVLAEYTARDPRVKAIHKANGGVTSARLKGVAEATGDWIGFVDGDDEIEPQMYERLLENAHAYGADISHCGYQRVFPDGSTELHYGSGALREQDRQTALRDLLEERLIEPGLCSKLFRRNLFQTLEERMDLTIKNNEDLLMNVLLFENADRAVYEDVCPYHYLVRQDSASRRKPNDNRIYDPIRVREIILETCEPELREDARQALLRTCLYVYALLTMEKGCEYDIHSRKVRQIIAEQKDYYYLLSWRNKLLAGMIKAVPWLFRGMFRGYVVCFRQGHYE